MRHIFLLLLVFLLFSCEGNENPVSEEGMGDPDVPVTADNTVPTPLTDEDAGAESSVSGELPFEYLNEDDFSGLGDCRLLLQPEDNPNRYVFGLSLPEGVGQGTFDGTQRTLPFVNKAENANGTTTYTHENDEYEAITRISSEVERAQNVSGLSGVVTIRRKRDGQAATFKILGSKGC